MKMYALLTTDGTAMAETALCEIHHGDQGQREAAEHDAQLDWDKGSWHDCTGNDALECGVCGATNETATPGGAFGFGVAEGTD